MDRPLRVCMFVYNSCRADVRVLKEAGTLLARGHDVEVIAVLDRTTRPEEVRDGLRITRIDRNPLHYRLLHRTRRARRSLRLQRARARRRVRALERHGLSRASRDRRRLRVRIRRRVLRMRRRRLAPLAAVVAGPARLYRALRWRALRRWPTLRRAFYRRRTRALRGRSSRRSRRLLLRRLLIEEQAARGRVRAGRRSVPARVVRALSALTRRPATAAASAVTIVDRAVSRRAYRALMQLHKPLMFMDYYARAYRHTRGRGFDVFHAHDLNTLPVAALAALRGHARLVYDSHELYPEISTLSPRESRIWSRIERWLIRRADAVITVCESIAGELQRRHRIAPPHVVLNCPPATTLPEQWNGANLLRERAGLFESGEPLVLYQGGFAPNRGLVELVEAASLIDRGVVVLMGWGVLEEELRSRVDRLGLDGRVVLIPPATVDELLLVTRGADVGVIPYRPVGLNNTYTTPNKLFEYMAAGVPIAGSRLPELTRFIEGLGIGVTFDPADPRDLARSLDRMLGDVELLREMRDRALSARERFVWEAQAETLLDVYRAISDDDAGHSPRTRRA